MTVCYSEINPSVASREIYFKQVQKCIKVLIISSKNKENVAKMTVCYCEINPSVASREIYFKQVQKCI